MGPCSLIVIVVGIDERQNDDFVEECIRGSVYTGKARWALRGKGYTEEAKKRTVDTVIGQSRC